MKRLVGLLAGLFLVLVPSVGHAGGWAVASFDPIPPLAAGEDATIGFQLLQHGVTPVVAAEWPEAEVGVSVRAGGESSFVPATPGSEPGRYTVTVSVPAGVTSVSLFAEMRNGLVVAEQWVDVPVGAATAAAAAGGGSGGLPGWTAPLLALLAAGCGAFALFDWRASRRSRPSSA